MDNTGIPGVQLFLACQSVTALLPPVLPIMLAFYGGEPLLNLMLIKQSVEYIKEKAFGKNIKFAITTNGTLLTHEIVDFLVENNFQLAISLDGPESVHDQHRKFANSDKGSFRILKENYLSILNRYPEYAKKITFNTVLTFLAHTRRLRTF